MSTTWIEAAVAFGADVLVLSTVVVAVALLLARAGRRAPAWRHAVLRSGLVLVALAPFAAWGAGSIELPRWSRSPLVSEAAPALPAVPPTRPSAVDVPAGRTARSIAPPERAPSPSPEPAAPGLDPWALLLAAWCLGAGLGALRLAHGLLVVRRLGRGSRPARHAAVRRAGAQVRLALGVSRLPAIHTSAATPTPLAIGFVRPRVLLPERLADGLGDEALRDVLIHECAHVVRRDAWMGLLQRALTTLLWPHPLIHLASRALDRAREELCDNHVLRVSEPVRYSRTLLDVARCAAGGVRTTPALTLFPPRWSLEQRVAGLLDDRRRPMTRLRRLPALLVLCALGATAVAASAAHTFQSQFPREDGVERVDVSGQWNGGEWGRVTIQGDEGTYTSTWNGQLGTIRIARTGRRAFSGLWRESDLHGGTLELVVSRDGRVIEGSYRIHSRAKHDPAHAGTLRWTFERAVVTAPVPSEEVVTVIVPAGAEPAPADADLESSIRLLTARIERFPTNTEAYVRLGRSLLQAGRAQEALAVLERALELAPEDDSAALSYAIASRHVGDYARSQATLGRLLERYAEERGGDTDPENAEALRELGTVYQHTGRYEAATEAYRAALENYRRIHGEGHADTNETRYRYAVLLRQVGRLMEAQALQDDIYARSVEMGDVQATLRALRELSELASQLGDLDRARSYLQRVRELIPDAVPEEEPDDVPEPEPLPEPRSGAVN